MRNVTRSLLAALIALLASANAGALPSRATQTFRGALADGSAYRIDVPANWNGTLVLYSHGYAQPSRPFELAAIFDRAGIEAVETRGYAVAASAYPYQGWAVQAALFDQMQLLDRVPSTIGRAPAHTIAVGDSMGGDITAGLIQTHPDRFSGGLPVCGAVSGLPAMGPHLMSATLAANALIGLPRATARSQPYGDLKKSLDPFIATAQESARGRARLSLVAALLQIPGWNAKTLGAPEPAASAVEANQAASLQWVLPFLYVIYADLQHRIGSAPLASPGRRLRLLVAASPEYPTVRALYAAAHLSLDSDLAAARRSPPYPANAFARRYLQWFFVPDGSLRVPVLSVHTLGDDLVPVGVEDVYRELVDRAGDGGMLRDAYVARYGHCTFTPAEFVVSLDALERRVETGTWGDLSPSTLNRRAGALGALNELFFEGKGRNVRPAFSGRQADP